MIRFETATNYCMSHRCPRCEKFVNLSKAECIKKHVEFKDGFLEITKDVVCPHCESELQIKETKKIYSEDRPYIDCPFCKLTIDLIHTPSHYIVSPVGPIMSITCPHCHKFGFFNSKEIYYNMEDHKMTKVERHMKLCNGLNTIYAEKNHDYGDAFHTTYLEEGFAMARIRLTDKLERFKSLTKKGAEQKVKGESIRDTLLDLANYAIMTVMEMDLEEEEIVETAYDLDGRPVVSIPKR